MKTVHACLACFTLSVSAHGQISKFISPATDEQDHFGGSVAIHGDRAIIGANVANGWGGAESGAAYFFDLNTGQQVVDLNPCNGTGFERFGYPVAISATRAIGGASFADGAGGTNSGKAYLFEVPSGICLHALEPANSSGNDYFGSAVAVSDDYAVVGAANSDGHGADSGAVYVFDATTGQELHELVPSDAGPFLGFGNAVAIHGNLVAVGASNGHGMQNFAGAVYLFDATTGTERAKIIAPDGQTADRFGERVAMEGSRLLVGAPHDKDLGNQSGSAYLFDRLSGQFVAKVLAPDGGPGDRFGSAVTTDGDRAAIGAPGNEGWRGASYLFDALTGDYVTKHQATDGQMGDQFGSSLAIYGGNLLVGASGDDDVGADAGAAYIFRVTGPSEHTGKPYCFGDGTGSPCPCSANGAEGAGCQNSSGSGATLSASGNASVTFDNFQVDITGLPPGSLGLLLRGNNGVNMGLGTAAGDGLLCTGGNSWRSQVEVASAGQVTMTHFQGQPFGASSYQSGATTNYQFWYRDTAGTCSGAGFNFTNAWAVKWLP